MNTMLRHIVVFVGLFAFVTFAHAEPRKNVLFIVVDDLNTHLACYGDPVVQTPNIDRLAGRGVQFDRAYCQYPVCNPSRVSFMSGLHPETTGVMTQQATIRQKMPDAVMLPEHFRNNGYFTAAIGKVEHGGHREIKWDLFDDVKGSSSETDDEEAAPRPRRRAGQAPARTPTRAVPGQPAYLSRRATAEDDPELFDLAVANRTIELMEAKREQPFFIVAGLHKPHVPHVAPQRFFDMYPPDKMQTVNVPAGDEKDIPPVALQSNANYQPDMPDEEKRRIIAAYLACVSFMDEQVGKMMAAMDRLDLWDSTIVVFTSDHGWHFGEHNWWAKASLFEPSARVPLIVVAPGTKAGEASRRVVGLIDLYPTLAELCALSPPPQGEGRSFAPLLSDPQQAWENVAYTSINRGGRAVRNDRYRYAEWDSGRRGVELYDLQNDPDEHHNLADSPEHAAVVSEMKQLLQHRGP